MNIKKRMHVGESFGEKNTEPHKKPNLGENLTEDMIDLKEIDEFLDAQNERELNKETTFTNLFYKLNGKENEHPIKVDNGWADCPFCGIQITSNNL